MAILEILQKYWGYSSFRPLQIEIIESVLAGKDTLALLPTGGGKSICFQVPAMALKGICIVVSPLIALMQDQVNQLQKRGIQAYALYTGMSQREIDISLDNCIHAKNVKFLYVSPERLKTTLFLERVRRMNVSLLAIDEAHCISQWGYDFRPPYLEIAAFRQILPNNVPCIALTASATERVKKDIIEKLQFRKNFAVFQKSFARPNLSYSVFQESAKEKRLLEILQKVQGTAIVYVRSRKRTEQLASFLLKNHQVADFYHAGLTTEERIKKQESWVNGQTRIIVATNAFGMGIDKPDVRLVVHVDLPPDLESYYQEAGRAGRDTLKAFAVVLYEKNDIDRLYEQLDRSFPPVTFLREVYQALANHYKIAIGSGEMVAYEFDLEAFSQKNKWNPSQVYYALKRLEDEELIQFNDAFSENSKLMLHLQGEELYKFQVSYPIFDNLLKTIMRLYGGEVFSQMTSITESQLAKMTRQAENKVRELLLELHKGEVITYHPRNEKPQLLFLQERVPAQRILANTRHMNERKKLLKEKIDSVVHYLTHPLRCRTALLCAYFGEQLENPCGICDTCLHQRKKEKDEEYWRNDIKKTLLQRPVSLEALIAHLPMEEKEHTIELIRQMLDEQEIFLREDGTLAVKM